MKQDFETIMIRILMVIVCGLSLSALGLMIIAIIRLAGEM